MAGYDPIFPTTKGILRKLGGDKVTKKKVLLDGVFDPHEFDTCYMFETEILAVGDRDEVTINWNGKRYACIVFEQEGITYFGNLSLADGVDDTGEPFVYSIMSDDAGNESGVFITADTGSITVTVTVETETIVPIDPKYLPGVYLPVVEFTEPPTATGNQLTDAEAATMDNLIATKVRAFLLLLNSNDVIISIVMSYANVILGADAFAGTSGVFTLLLQKEENGAWTLQSVG